MAMYSDNSLKSAQLKAVNRMLAFNNNDIPDGNDYLLPPAGSSHNQWKILIYDKECRGIISPLLSVAQLRRRGVTLHLLLDSDREPIPDVPVVYFCQPTKQNLARIAQDCANRLYGRAHLNFVTMLDRELMEDFAKLVVQSGSLDTIASVHDQYLDYVCMERQLFTLNRLNSYVAMNGSGTTERAMEAQMTEIAYGLFSVVATLGYVPIIRCPKGGAPEMVARKLNKMIAEHPSLMRSGKAAGRPLLVLQDRNSDLMTPIQHASTYQALIDDLLVHSANRVEFTVTTGEEGKRPKIIQKKYDLDPDQDPFYSNHKFNPFPEAIERNGVELQEVTRRETEIRTRAVGGGGFAAENPSNDLSAAVDSLPALLDRKKQLEVHTSILQAVMTQVASRDVPQFFELETGLATGTYKNDLAKAQKEVLELVTDPSKGNVEDKVRLVLVYSLATTAKSSAVEEVAEAMKNALETKGSSTGTGKGHGTLDKEDRAKLEMGLRAISYIKQMRSMNMMIPMASETLVESSHPSNSAMLTSFMKSATNQATGLLAKASEKVGSILGKIHKNHLTRIVENLCEMRPGSEDDSYLYLDPKVKGDVDVNNLRTMAARAPITKIIAFMIGGGCYAEYQNLQMVANERRTVSYGSTELLDPCKFLVQLGQLG
ncbi:hypothetical protein MHU86_11159 [Fragilaria crotonensis]|nr:hypothetical protein MHU86_11159 [Fragilaria crotonensis]